MVGAEQPPWKEWSTMDVEGIRREHARARLADAQWLAAIIADLKDEDYLVKRRTAPPGERKVGGKPPGAKEGA